LRKLFTLFFLILLACQGALAQQDQQSAGKQVYDSRISGLKAGINLASFSGTNMVLGLHAGFYGEERIRKNFGYGGEANLNLQGGKSGATTGLLYFTIPALANLYVGKTTLQAGIYGALLLASGSDSPYGSSTNMENTDYGLTAGFKTRLVHKLGIGARYYLGLQDISGRFSKTHNRNIQIGLNYDF
jgi:hypothetical protein